MDVLYLNSTGGENEVPYKLKLMDLLLEPCSMETVPLD